MMSRHSIACPVTILVLLTLLAVQPQASASDAGQVTAINAPAWLLRAGVLSPLRPGQRLRSGDGIRTGQGGRALLSLADGSDVRLGSAAVFDLERFDAAVNGGVFRGLLRVLKGAFRYTTNALGRARRRELKIRVAGITAGIRGTDVWGRATPEEDIFCLIEGAVRVQRGDEPAIDMNEPLTFYRAPRGAPAHPVAPVAREQLARWAASVDVVPARGVISHSRGYAVVLESNRSEASSLGRVEQLRTLGFAAEIEDARVRGERWYRVVIRGFADRASAAAFATTITGRHGVRSTWLSAPR